jgi:hypothetical protein
MQELIKLKLVMIEKDNDKKIGVLKEEFGMMPILEFIGLMAKLYSLLAAYLNDKGEFELGQIPNGTYILKLSFLGYETKFISPIQFSETNSKIDFKTI